MPKRTMSYSVAFHEYTQSVREIGHLLRSIPSDSLQLSSVAKRKLANALQRSIVVLLSSHLERYCESLTVEAIDAINLANLQIEKIPNALRMAQIDNPLRSVHEIKDIEKKIKSLKAFVIDYSWFWDGTQSCNTMRGEELIRNFSNPLPKAISGLFLKFEIANVIGRASALDSKQGERKIIEGKVQELVEKRNGIAHTGMTTTVTREDVLDYLRCTCKLVRYMDKVVGEEIKKIIQIWPWVG